MSTEDRPPSRGRAALALLLLVPAPTIGTAAALHWWPGPTGQAVYAASKAWLLALPLAWHLLVDRGRLSVRGTTRRALLDGLSWGALIAVTIVAGYLTLGRALIDPAPARAALSAAGLTTPLRYLGLALYLAFVNSLLEEYAWRWFVTSRWAALVPPRAAIVLSAACFTLHHCVALAAQLGWLPNLAASAGVFAGGVIWSWLYVRHGSVWPAWVSHVLADLAVLGVGAHLVFGSAA